MKASTIFCTECGAANPTLARFCFACGQAVQWQGKASGGASQTGQIKPGELLRKRYEVLNLIGQGGFGAVYKAEDKELGQPLVAVKDMGEQGLNPPPVAERGCAC